LLRSPGKNIGVQIVAQVSDPNRNDLQLIVEFKRADTGVFSVDRMSVAAHPSVPVSGAFRLRVSIDVRAYWFRKQGAARGRCIRRDNCYSDSVSPTVAGHAYRNSTGSALESFASCLGSNARPTNYSERRRIFRNTSTAYAGPAFVE